MAGALEAPPPLAELLQAAEPRGPAALRGQQAAGATLALALHTLMAHDGFQAVDAAGRRLKGAAPLPDWNAGEAAWSFTYCRPGAARPFRLQCALQAATRRMFIHAAELDGKGEPLPDNIQVMGVQLDRYVPTRDEVAATAGASWQGVVGSEEALVTMFEEFILRPLWRQAEKAPQGAAGSESGIAGLLRERRREVLTAAAILTAAAAGVLAWRWRKHNAQAFVAG